MCSLLLLPLLMKADNQSTLLTTCPLEALLLPDARDAPHHPRSPLAWLGRTVLCVALQFAWGLRALCLPVLGGLGTAQAFAASGNAQDIVLNSVAIGFVYELDDILYTQLLGKAKREKHEAAMALPRVTSPLSARFPQGRRIVSNYAWVIWAVDAWYQVQYYLTYTMYGPVTLTCACHRPPTCRDASFAPCLLSCGCMLLRLSAPSEVCARCVWRGRPKLRDLAPVHDGACRHARHHAGPSCHQQPPQREWRRGR